MAVTLRDVARAAGVSPATASRALSAPDLVAPERRELVRRVARELGYRPNLAARQLRNGRSGLIALVLPDLREPYFAEFASQFVSAAQMKFSLLSLHSGQTQPSGRFLKRVPGATSALGSPTSAMYS